MNGMRFSKSYESSASPMMRYLPFAAWNPPMRALPYPFFSTWTTRAPFRRAISMEPSVEPLSATTTSPDTWDRTKKSSAFRMQVSIVSASFRHGITTETSIGREVWALSISFSELSALLGIVRYLSRPPAVRQDRAPVAPADRFIQHHRSAVRPLSTDMAAVAIAQSTDAAILPKHFGARIGLLVSKSSRGWPRHRREAHWHLRR